ncbi:SHOCT domain-containing protein [Sphingobium sp.]|uniref:SHOCT domain-containing protein n=1 Tax=Sphingobium sp. TaxID=1912891 RepID=UPI003B3A52D6
MNYVTIGNELRRLFSRYEAGNITTAVFERRKRELLDYSKCHLLRRAPRRLRG